ncbi:MAG: 50S ribosomal protein L32e [Candidatus Nanohaloarchaea archaeon]|nr:50S ribosomal protein L32e [Candidatus Nanohaloarchaea archaeon]
MSDDFKRQNSHKHKRVPESWRRPRGTHSPRRKEEKHAAAVPKPGYRTPAEDRGKHPSGYDEVLVHTPAGLDEVDPETEAVRIGSSVGGRKREDILEDADERGIHVLNRGDE